MPARQPRVYTLPPSAPFVDTLARGLLARSHGDPLSLAAVTVLLPTRRAARALRDAFLRAAEGRAAILPRMLPLGDLDAEELALNDDAAAALPPAIAPLRRQLMLARLVLHSGRFASGLEQATALAEALGRFLDAIATEEIDAKKLAAIVPEDLAAHWQQTLTFLEIATKLWPRILAGEGALDPAARRNAVLAAQARSWRRQPPLSPVIAAGSTGSIPAAARLLKIVARLPAGEVILPGLDQSLDAPAWEALEEHHPQFALKRLIETIGITREAVRPWPDAPRAMAAASPRAALISELFRPASTVERWQGLALPPAATAGCRALTAADQQEEAEAIALMLRETLETPARTAALVTPDRALAARVAIALKRWGIAVNDSGGRPLAEMPVGLFLRLIGAAVRTRMAPLDTLALLKHPLATGAETAARFRRQARALELAVFRGPRPGPGFAAIRAALTQAEERRFGRRVPRAGLLAWLDGLEAIFAPFATLFGTGREPHPLAAWVEAHLALAEALAATAERPGAERLWRREDGEAAAALFDTLLRSAHDFPALGGEDYLALLDRFLQQTPVRPVVDVHPRLAILGLLEARLQHFDRIVIGGLNEGRFPNPAAADPWLSRPMQQALGLPTGDRAIGQQAHDLAQLLGAPEVILTRAARVDKAPARASRWWLRLETVLRAAGIAPLDAATPPWHRWSVALNTPAQPPEPAAPPMPRPPLALRPRRLSVSDIETWARDPYSLFARRILKLEPLEPIDADVDAAERGRFIHAALDAFQRAYPAALPEDALARLLDEGAAAFGARLAKPEVAAFWWPRFERIAAWFLAREAERRPMIAASATEIRGSVAFRTPGGPFTLHAKADRLDRLHAGRVVIIDYKTGSLPSGADVARGFSPQLPLEAWIAAAAGFGEGFVPPEGECGLEYWQLSGGEPAGEVKPLAGDMAALIAAARDGLIALVTRFDDPATPYTALPRAKRGPRFSPYAHLARRDEWRQAETEGS
jgi:ATP-dependent helicase/nuclease subunit B